MLKLGRLRLENDDFEHLVDVALNLTTAQELFTNPAAPGWEPGSVEAGNNLALQVLQTIASAGANGTVNALTSATGLPEWALLLGAAGLLWAILR